MASHEHALEKGRATHPASLLPTMKDAPPDAGTRHLDHYATKLPPWRHALRQSLIPLVRWETPYLALLQERTRTPALDSYFAFTANLGTHTFFMIMLPIFFWCGYTSVGRAMVNMLAAGVIWSGFIKDMLCLPRPLSPPLQRISHSGSAALEYGFPSTHSTNAISVVIYSVWALQTTSETRDPYTHLISQGLLYAYAISIVFGRLYCGMHGFLDVIIGSILGAIIAVIQIVYGHRFDMWVSQGGYEAPLIVTLAILILVRVHPEPADDCPCFDDSVSFAGVVIGAEVGMWHYTRTQYSSSVPVPGTVPFNLQEIGWPRAVGRVLFGVAMIFAWRGITKPTLLKVLPPIFRLIERIRLNMPRRFFLQASQYKSVPHLRKDDNVIPPASDIPRLFDTLRHPRKRSVSVGPQSAADVYETIAYRHMKRRESLSSVNSPVIEETSRGHREPQSTTSATPAGGIEGADVTSSPTASRIQELEQMMGTGRITRGDTALDMHDDFEDEEQEAREIFLRLERPRVRYDVEVITKLVIYSGIGWLATEMNPILMTLCGLGLYP